MPESHSLSLQHRQYLENIVEQFEADFQRGEEPQIESFLPKEEPDRFTLLVELIHTDLEQRLKAGESARVEDFQIRFPELTESQLLLGDLIVTEYALRLQLDSQLDVAEYAERFPQWGDRLINRLRDALKGAKRIRFLQATHAETIIQSGDATHSQKAQRTTSQHFDGPEQTQAPQNYDRYVVKELLGAGAFGQVFLAHDPKTERDVALKVPRRRLPPGSEEEERFLREARAVATLQHQNICPLFDLLETDGCIVLVMPYIDGNSLAEEIRLRPPSLDESVRLVRTLATAMSYAHDSGVVHRDLKPANILVAREQSTPFITDFGLATRCRSDDAQLTQEGQVLGTPAYMSPEQATGDVDQIGITSDIYSLGIILYELCVGQLPFTGSVTAVIRQVISEEPAEPSSINRDISPGLNRLILQAIAKTPTDRFQSMGEFASALSEMERRTHAASLGRAQRFINKWPMIVGVAVLVLAAIGLAFFKPVHPQTNATTPVLKPRDPVPDAIKPVLLEKLDLLKEVQVLDDAIVGNWSMNPDGLMVNPKQFSRLSIPVHTVGAYRLDVELTRKWGNSEVNLVFPVGNRSCMLSLGQNDWCGLQLVSGHELGQVVQGHFPSGQRHKLTLAVAIRKQQASIKAHLNGLSILDWNGAIDALAVRGDWQVPNKSFGLGAHYDQVIFHSMVLSVENEAMVSNSRWKKRETGDYQVWRDLLDEVVLPRHVFMGDWQLVTTQDDPQGQSAETHELAIERRGEYSRLILPVVPTGDYQLAVHLTRTAGVGEINFILPVGKSSCMISIGNEGNQFRIQNVDETHWGILERGLFTNRKQHVVNIDVSLGSRESATILLKIDNQEVFHWQGKQSELSIRQEWNVHPRSLGLSVHQDAVRFQKVMFRNQAGTVFHLE